MDVGVPRRQVDRNQGTNDIPSSEDGNEMGVALQCIHTCIYDSCLLSCACSYEVSIVLVCCMPL